MKKKSLMHKAESRKLVKITSTGKVVIRLEKEVKPLIRSVLANALDTVTPRYQLNPATAGDRIYTALIREIFQKLFSEMHIVKDGRVLLTMSQALAFWKVCYNDHRGMRDPAYNFLMLQLHQRLTP